MTAEFPDTVKVFCLSPPLSAVTSLSSAAESVTSTHTTAQSAAHPPPRSTTKHAGNRREEALLVIWSHCNVRVEVRVSYPKPPELHSETSVCGPVFQSESLLVCSSLMLLVITVILATTLWKLHSKEVLSGQQWRKKSVCTTVENLRHDLVSQIVSILSWTRRLRWAKLTWGMREWRMSSHSCLI